MNSAHRAACPAATPFLISPFHTLMKLLMLMQEDGGRLFCFVFGILVAFMGFGKVLFVWKIFVGKFILGLLNL